MTNEVSFNAKTGDLIGFPTGTKAHKVLDSYPNGVDLAEPFDDGEYMRPRFVTYERLIQQGAFFVNDIAAANNPYRFV